MDLKVGMYVRTKLGSITKIENEVSLVRYMGETPNVRFSHNIIDLIQSKDLIVDTKNNLYVVDRVEGNYVFTTSKNEYGLIITLVDYQIKSILTKEQYESMSYKVVE